MSAPDHAVAATRPWDGPDVLRTDDMLDGKTSRKNTAGGDGKTITERILAPGKKERMKIIYRMLKDNYSVSGKEIKEALGLSGTVTKLVYESINTLDDFLPIWQETDDHDRRVMWFGILDRERHTIPELEDGADYGVR